MAKSADPKKSRIKVSNDLLTPEEKTSKARSRMKISDDLLTPEEKASKTKSEAPKSRLKGTLVNGKKKKN